MSRLFHSHRAFALVNTRSVDDVGPLIDRINAFLDNNLPTARADAKRMWFGSTEPGIVQIRLVGPDGEVLSNRAERIIEAFHAVPGTITGVITGGPRNIDRAPCILPPDTLETLHASCRLVRTGLLAGKQNGRKLK